VEEGKSGPDDVLAGFDIVGFSMRGNLKLLGKLPELLEICVKGLFCSYVEVRETVVVHGKLA
jgi:hypothetical protein